MLQLNWKAAATMVTGATALVGWLASPSEPAARRATARSATRSAAPASTVVTTSIEEQATRLGNRIRPSVTFDAPQRNPFRYQPVAPPPRPVAAISEAAAQAAQPVVPEPFPFRLSGTARDGTSEAPVWTAILAGGTAGLVLAHVGDTLGSVYKIESVTDTSVVVVDLRDSRTIQLTLPAPR